MLHFFVYKLSFMNPEPDIIVQINQIKSYFQTSLANIADCPMEMISSPLFRIIHGLGLSILVSDGNTLFNALVLLGEDEK